MPFSYLLISLCAILQGWPFAWHRKVHWASCHRVLSGVRLWLSWRWFRGAFVVRWVKMARRDEVEGGEFGVPGQAAGTRWKEKRLPVRNQPAGSQEGPGGSILVRQHDRDGRMRIVEVERAADGAQGDQRWFRVVGVAHVKLKRQAA